MRTFEENRAWWAKKVDAILERWVKTELGLITVERWQTERRALYSEMRYEMVRTGNDFFLPKNLKLLVQIKTPMDLKIKARWDSGWAYCQENAAMNEVDKVLDGLRILEEIERYLQGPYGFTIYGNHTDGLTVDEPDRGIVFKGIA